MNLLAQADPKGLLDACGVAGERRFTCEFVYNWTSSETLASTADWIVGRAWRIAVILVLAWIASYIAKRAIVRLTVGISKPVMGVRSSLDISRSRLARSSASTPKKAVTRRLRRIKVREWRKRKAARKPETPKSRLKTRVKPRPLSRRSYEALESQDPLLARARDRASARAETLGRVLRSLALAAIWSLAIILIIGELGVNLGPLVAGAGIAGVALGFGAQSVVKDFLSGLFMLMEDNYGVGDMVDFGGVMGTVIDVTLRSTAFKDRDGIVWHVPNGQIERVGNFSQLGLRARLNISVAYDTDLREAIRVTNLVGARMWDADECAGKLAAPPSVSGVQELGEYAILIRVIVETLPGLLWNEKRGMERLFRLNLKEAYDAAGIVIPFPQRDLWIRDANDTSLGELGELAQSSE
ncbi:MAG: mechanosensitive ion channel family protein [Acidimicrobiaceae bacterium]|nr:mechanosensitive ion channel family protein [Acidimicrobiaceae bacterium]